MLIKLQTMLVCLLRSFLVGNLILLKLVVRHGRKVLPCEPHMVAEDNLESKYTQELRSTQHDLLTCEGSEAFPKYGIEVPI